MSENEFESTARVLVVDDDRDILRVVRLAFEIEAFEVATAASAAEALDWMSRHGLPDLGVFDMNMPGMSGLELCEVLHSYCDLPILFLTVVDDEETVVSTIDAHAEDYLAKPFRPRELVARAKRVLRRVGRSTRLRSAETRIDARLSIRIASQTVLVDGRELSLTPTESKILHLLLRAAPRAVGTETLLRRVWTNDDVYEDALRVHVHRLRQKLEVDPARPGYILTQRGFGYEFRLPGAAGDVRDAGDTRASRRPASLIGL